MLKVKIIRNHPKLSFFPSTIVILLCHNLSKCLYWVEMAWRISRRIYWILNLDQWTYLSSLVYFFALLIHIDFFVFLYASSFSLHGSRQYLFFSLVLAYIAFWKSLFIKGAWLPLTSSFFKGACLSIAYKKFSDMDL